MLQLFKSQLQEAIHPKMRLENVQLILEYILENNKLPELMQN